MIWELAEILKIIVLNNIKLVEIYFILRLTKGNFFSFLYLRQEGIFCAHEVIVLFVPYSFHATCLLRSRHQLYVKFAYNLNLNSFKEYVRHKWWYVFVCILFK